MREHQSLDSLVAKKAVEFADQIRAAAAMADKEEEIRIEVEKQLAFIQKEAGVKLEGRHEFTVASGRVDSVYDRVIIEYKNPKSPGDRIGPGADSPGTKKVVEQIKRRFYDMRSQFHQPLNTLFGVGLDGNYFVFIRFRDDKWQVQDPVEVNKYSAERFLWALFNLGQKGKSFSADYLAGDFGSEGGNTIAGMGIHTLYEAIHSTTHPKARTFFSQWKILFGEVCGYDVDNPSDKIKKLARFYAVSLQGLKPAELLFAVHSYYGIFMKLLASEIVAFFHRLPTPLQGMMQAPTSAKLKREMEELEAGSIFRHLNITNFLEGDLFAWYTSVWSEPVEQLVRNMVGRLDDYNPGTLSEDPASSRDLLKKLYQQLFPKSVRHDLGEYYTPDWLAEHVLNDLGYIGDPEKRILDPACGSGTFLVMAINRIRAWYEENRERCSFGDDALCRKILRNVIGFDLNPLAVMAARTNYLIAIRDLISHIEQVEIPIYLCDSILTPSTYGGLFAGTTEAAKELKTAAAKFLVPTEIATRREDVAKYAEQLEACVKNGCSPQEFVERCQDEGLPISVGKLHTDLYTELVNLDRANKNGVWARIIKNAFAPLFIQRADYVAGNPPWVNWESLPSDYRDAMKPLWQKYALFSLSGSEGRLGGGKKDLAMLFVYISADNYLKDGGRLGFVITQTVFKTKGAGDGFRRFEILGRDGRIIIRPDIVHDLSRMQVFQGATNRTATIAFTRSRAEFQYPVEYVFWRGPSTIDQDMEIASVLGATTRTRVEAVPVDSGNRTSPWLTAPRKALDSLQSIRGNGAYRAYASCCTWLNGVYWVRVIRTTSSGSLLVENMHDVGRIRVEHVRASVEPNLVYPLLRGRDISRWQANPTVHLILTQDPETRSGIPEGSMKRQYPKTYAYMKRFEALLRNRSGYRKFFRPTDPFYSVYNVGSYSMAPFRVAWAGEVATSLNAAVVLPDAEGRPVLTDQTAYQVPVESLGEADFLCALLNSLPVRAFYRFVAYKHTSMKFIRQLAFPKYNEKCAEHQRLAELAQCAREFSKRCSHELKAIERQIDQAVAILWNIPRDHLDAIQEGIAILTTRGSVEPEDK